MAFAITFLSAHFKGKQNRTVQELNIKTIYYAIKIKIPVKIPN